VHDQEYFEQGQYRPGETRQGVGYPEAGSGYTDAGTEGMGGYPSADEGYSDTGGGVYGTPTGDEESMMRDEPRVDRELTGRDRPLPGDQTPMYEPGPGAGEADETRQARDVETQRQIDRERSGYDERPSGYDQNDVQRGPMPGETRQAGGPIRPDVEGYGATPSPGRDEPPRSSEPEVPQPGQYGDIDMLTGEDPYAEDPSS
jgi:hypothetical protein